MKLQSLLMLLVWMITPYKILCETEDERNFEDKADISDSSLKISPSSLSLSWQNDDSKAKETSGEVLVFENDQSLNDEKLKFKRNSILKNGANGDHQTPQVAALHAGPSPRGVRGGQVFPTFNIPSCGMCSRERNRCQIISGIFTRPSLPYGYSLVTPIPSGVCNITIVEIKPSKNYFALRQKDGNYVLNGNWDLQAAGNYRLGGTVFDYSPADGIRGEKLEAPGPLLEPLDLMIIYQSQNPGIKYEYRVPLPDLGAGHQARIIPIHNSASVAGGSNSYSHLLPGVQQTIPLAPGSPNANFPKISHVPLESSGGVPANWNSPSAFLPPSRSYSGIPSRAQGINLPAPNNFPTLGKYPSLQKTYPQPRYSSPHLPPTIQKVYNKPSPLLPQLYSDISSSRFSNDRFSGVLNTEPRTITKPDESNFILTSTYEGPAVGGNSRRPIGNAIDSVFSPNIRPKYNKRIGNQIKEKTRKKNKKNRRRNGRKRKGRFQWIFKGLTECSRSCGGGEQVSVFSCEKRRKGKVVADKMCHDVPLPELKTVTCNLRPCPAKWVPGKWSPCNVTCGKGIRTRELKCKQEVSPTLTMMVHAGACVLPKEENITEECILDDCPSKIPQWRIGEWSQCSAECGPGTRTRNVQCIYYGSHVDEFVCSEVEEKPESKVDCDIGTCVTENTWFFSPWTEKCTNDCESGVKSRTVVCIQSEFDFEDTCPIETRPDPITSCTAAPKCKGQWFSGSWSSCSVTCGVGVETRIVKCLDTKGLEWVIMAETSCPKNVRPLESRECFQVSCSPRWFTTDWSQCSKSCAGGIQNRDVKCLDTHLEASFICPNSSKPSSSQKCNPNIKCYGEDEYAVTPRVKIERIVDKTTEPPTKSLSIDENLAEKSFKNEENLAGDSDVSKEISNDINGPKSQYNAGENYSKEENSYGWKVDPSTEDQIIHDGSMKIDDQNSSAEYDESVSDIENNKISSVVNNEIIETFEEESNQNENQQTNHIEAPEEKTGAEVNAIPDKDAQGDESAMPTQDDIDELEEQEELSQRLREQKKDKQREREKTKRKNRKNDLRESMKDGNCIDRIKNCHLVFRARLCRLKYYNKLCCITCKS